MFLLSNLKKMFWEEFKRLKSNFTFLDYNLKAIIWYDIIWGKISKYSSKQDLLKSIINLIHADLNVYLHYFAQTWIWI